MPNIKRGMMGAAGVAFAGYNAWLWGSGYKGTIGDGTVIDRSSPVQVGENWTRISSKKASTHAIKTDGTLWGWGQSSWGKLGNGQVAVDYSSPVQIGDLTDWVGLTGQWAVTFATKTDGTLWAWGTAPYGTLGTGVAVNASSPVQVGALTTWSTAGKKMSSYKHVLAIKTDGTLWSWGYGWQGILGTGTSGINASSPVQVGALTTWANVATGYKHCMAIKTDGTLWAWGDSGIGVLGDGQSVIDYSSPIQIGALTDWAQVSSGRKHTHAIKTNGTLWFWGSPANGASGADIDPQISSPIQIGALTDWSYVKVGFSTTMAIKTDGTLWAWGKNTGVGNLGQGDRIDTSSPVQVGVATDWLDVQVSWSTNTKQQVIATRGTAA